MKFNKGDYVVCLDDEGKKRLCIIDNPKNCTCIVSDKTAAHKSTMQYLNYGGSNLMAYLGSTLDKGSVYGVQCIPFFKKDELENYLGIYYFRDSTEDERKFIRNKLKTCWKYMKANKLDSIFPIEVEVRPNRGKIVGYAKTTVDSDGSESNLMTLMPKELLDQTVDTIFHEFGHFIYNTRFRNKDKALWTELYAHYVKVEEANKHMLEKFKKLALKDGIYAMEDESIDSDLASEVVDYIEAYHSLRLKDLYTLSDAKKDITQYFPTYLELTDMEEAVSEYGMKDPEEFWCEAFSQYCVKGKLKKKKVMKLMINTLKQVKKY